MDQPVPTSGDPARGRRSSANDPTAGTAEPTGLALHAATEEDLTWVEQAVRSCPRTMAEMGGFYGAAATRLLPLLSPTRELLVVTMDGERVGFLDLDAEAEPAQGGEDLNITYFVHPDHRRQGVAARALAALVRSRPDVRLLAAISPDNAASQALAAAAGFSASGSNTWGDRVFVRPPGG